MGLGTKIKEALHGDHQSTTSHQTTGSHTTPGAFPSDELPQRHTDGKNYTAPHGTAVDETVNPGTHTGTTSGRMIRNFPGRHHANIHLGLASSGSHRNRLSKGTDDLDQTKGAYWGDLSKDGRSAAAGDLPDRTGLGEDSSAATGRHHGTHGHHHDHHAADQAVGGGVYNTAAAQGSHGSSNRDPTEDSRFGQSVTSTAASRDHNLTGQSSGGGVYNSITGSGSPEYNATRGSQTGAVHDPLSSGTKGVPLSSGHASGNNYDSQNIGHRGEGTPTAHSDRTGHSHGLGLAGAAAGAGAAGYAAHEHGQYNNRDSGYSGHKGSDGVPRSSMLDPEPASHSSSLPVGGQTGTVGYNDTQGTRGVPSGGYSSTGGQTGQFSGGPSHVNTNIGAGSGIDSSVSPTQSASSGSGRKHYGPGHEGAKVLHCCQHCGRDNDISHYFNKDVVYRLGQ